MDELISIGEFARLTRLSPRALRLYDAEGLLVPASVDQGTGYRWYAPAQARRAAIITAARELDMPLEEIRTLLEEDTDAARERIERRWDRFARGIGEQRRALSTLTSLVLTDDAWMDELDVLERGHHLCYRQGRFDEAVEAYLAVPDDHDGYVTARRCIGYNIYGRVWKRWAEGLPYLEEAARVAPDDPKVLEDLGRALIALGRRDEAAAILARARTPIAARALASLDR